MQLIVITPEKTTGDEATVVNGLFENGLQRLHIRKPSFTIKGCREYIAAIDSRYHSRITIHSCFELFEEFKLGGIHLNSALKNDKAVWAQISRLSLPSLSASFHSWQEIAENEAHYNYVFISPVFDSISKVNYKAGIDLHGAKRVKQELAAQGRYCPPVIGLGGVGVGQMETLYQHGFDGAAMLGAIWQVGNPVNTFIEAMKIINALQSD